MSNQMPKTTTVLVDGDDAIGWAAVPGNSPKVGIWWAEGQRIAAMLQSAAKIRTSELHVDSDLEHWREWPRVCHHFARPKEDNYFDVPRGRVLLNRKTNRGVIFHGNETPSVTCELIAKLYALINWSAHIDEHYLMGAEADALFDDEHFDNELD
jgi:phosphoglycolate phosphatase-like HAD superfamily hydrolase